MIIDKNNYGYDIVLFAARRVWEEGGLGSLCWSTSYFNEHATRGFQSFHSIFAVFAVLPTVFAVQTSRRSFYIYLDLFFSKFALIQKSLLERERERY